MTQYTIFLYVFSIIVSHEEPLDILTDLFLLEYSNLSTKRVKLQDDFPNLAMTQYTSEEKFSTFVFHHSWCWCWRRNIPAWGINTMPADAQAP